VGCCPSAKQARTAPKRAGLAGMLMRQPSVLVVIGGHWM
jgi:hypothetical protein